MRGVARISFQGGGLFLPAKTPYERELLFEHVNEYTKRHGQVRLDFSRKEWLVRLKASPAEICAACRQPLENLAYTRGDRTLCGQCVRRDFR